ncbi:3-phosphoserine/phosphohydroxythreonine transaminase [Halomonas denitrificans]|uniref:3-phosphoserine/phosphohydroxythreonine transaminase n=1 Tax=Halomonas TaxID=2745 RepID=UPI001C96CF3D|nr:MULTISPECIES: 3-phosphoserine/phosphohydroxythreonine transaminase [Halomonas]MBY5927239.1 3-phosphoserine/phosphohydroxythreonine transaminase [Halomonas sp. DP4Y7-2]MBY6234280.1 3-phosphoserine/phosphohydroxythreonine transaminase [Halomonas sp. DP4Y7-1]MCA0973864.1 3-phosphoserine/phosphohydroxythreonine transaminase [Halomonas denitrificans]MED5294485.1 3-phosphoserine/phosphohydroxythreonine transaminase [Pseudomonadota bacterium]
MTRHYNFCAGPAALPTAVLERAQREMLDYQGRGLSVMEMSHRSSEYVAIAEQAEADLRELLAVPDNYRVLFTQGGATQQFAAVPYNLLGHGGQANFLETGIWGKKAIKEAQHLFGRAHIAASSASNGHVEAPRDSDIALSDDAAYLHVTPNETIGGLALDYLPSARRADGVEVPLVADLSSTILSGPLDVSRYGVIYAGAQKNIGPAGLVLVIVRDDLLDRAVDSMPSLFSYRALAEAGSMINTPATYSWYLAGLVFDWLKRDIGGVDAMAEINARKAGKLYAAIDASDFYSNPIAKRNRSQMNVPFVLADSALEGDFLREAEAAGLLNLKGHRSVGGMRASLYNAVPEAAVDALVAFMSDFETRRG